MRLMVQFERLENDRNWTIDLIFEGSQNGTIGLKARLYHPDVFFLLEQASKQANRNAKKDQTSTCIKQTRAYHTKKKSRIMNLEKP